MLYLGLRVLYHQKKKPDGALVGLGGHSSTGVAAAAAAAGTDARAGGLTAAGRRGSVAALALPAVVKSCEVPFGQWQYYFYSNDCCFHHHH